MIVSKLISHSRNRGIAFLCITGGETYLVSPMEIHNRDVEAVDMTGNYRTDEEDAVEREVPVGAAEEEDGEGWEEDVERCYRYAVEDGSEHDIVWCS